MAPSLHAFRRGAASTQAALAGWVERATWMLAGALVVLVSANVFARYVLQIGWPWVEEVSRLLFVWVVFLGAFVALHGNRHMAIEFLTQRLSPLPRQWTLLFARVSVVLFLGIMVWSGASLVLTTYDLGRVTPILGISAAWGYLSVPVAGLLMLIDVVVIARDEPGGGVADAAGETV